MDLLNTINIIYLSALKKSTKDIIKNKILKVLKIIANIKTLKSNKIFNIILKLLLLDLLLMYF